MDDGITTLIKDSGALTDRMEYVNRDIRALLQFGPVLVTVGRFTSVRTRDQNAMHCGLCREIAKTLKAKTGMDYDVDYMRSKTKRKFGITSMQYDPDTGKQEPYLLSTTKYTKAQFAKLIEGTLAWAAVDLGIQIHRPEWADELRAA